MLAMHSLEELRASLCRVIVRSTLAALCVSTGVAYAQDTEAESESSSAPAIALTGSAMVTGDFYDFSSSGDVLGGPRRPPSLVRLVLSPTLNIAGRVSLPLVIMFSTRETSTITPPVTDPSISQFLLNQANSFSISPRLGWAQFHLGSHTPQYSELSAGNIQVFGVGTELRPGALRFSATAGSVQRAVEVDTAGKISGAFSRYLYAAKLGYESGDAEVALNFVRVRDDPASIRSITQQFIAPVDTVAPAHRDTIAQRHNLMPSAQEGLVATLSTRIPIMDGLTVSAEAGGSMYTRDMSASPIGERAEMFNALVRQRTSSRVDGAGKLTVDLEGSIWRVAMNALYMGAGYVTLGYPYLQADRLDLTVAPTFRLFDSAVTATGTFGHRTNNLTASMGTTTTQILASALVDAQLAEELSLNLSYSNFGMSTDETNDTFRIRTVSQAFSLTPAWSIRGDDIGHNISATLALDDYTDLNPISGATSGNNTLSALLTYAASSTGTPLSVDLSGLYLTNDLATADLTITTATLGVGYRLFKDALSPSVSFNYTTTTPEGFTSDSQLGLRLAVGWRITSKLRFNVAASTNIYEYGSSRAGGKFTENLVRSSLGWSF